MEEARVATVSVRGTTQVEDVAPRDPTAEESARLVIGKFVPFLLRVIEDRR